MMNIPLIDTAKKASHVPYLVAIVVMALLAVISVLGINMLRPNAENAPMVTQVLGFIGTITAGILVFMKTSETHLTVNSQMAEYKRDLIELQSLRTDVAAVAREQQRVETLRVAKVHESALLNAQPQAGAVDIPLSSAVVSAEVSTAPVIGTPLRVGDPVKLAPVERPSQR